MTRTSYSDEMTPKERMEAVLSGKPFDRIPCSINPSYHAAKLTGVKHWECYFSAEKIAEVQLASHQIFGVEAVITGPGLHGIAEAAGSTVVYPKEENSPYISEFAIQEEGDLGRLGIPNPWAKGRLPIHLTALQILMDRVGTEVPVTTNVAGPFTVAANLRGTETFLRDLYQTPVFAHRLLRYALESTLAYVQEAAKIGVKINIADPTASTSLISPRHFYEYAFPYLSELISQIKRLTGSAPSLHICGNTKKIWQHMADTGAGILSLDDTIDLADAKVTVGNRTALLGNVKPTATMFLGKPADVVREAKECLRKAYDNPKGYILALGCGLPMKAPVENVHALFQAARKFGRYPVNPESWN
ncbi:Uroporphyrinogen decarboxylase [Sporomusa silvacetica DSM 10669]|uniref:Uroporphyrinogen decarboxylase n=1 Tax=Sporomusa silvacetica DSM 10669 TaxID=1123289 RepID=A0ABZ3IHB3_9FIRM|nr:uroporphyrinogen decarboxylase family protein [Sporomusa silvacetica]OZC14847.1 uroporphyrinogen decarboxylase [Sporomusa silvacetica DSM 10669]